MSYRIFETDNFSKDTNRFSRSVGLKLAVKLKEYVYPILRIEPHYGPNIKRLKGYEPTTWRYRVGHWRFFYEIDEGSKIVFMLAASHRSSAYKK